LGLVLCLLRSLTRPEAAHLVPSRDV
jgi:hypothetical protein